MKIKWEIVHDCDTEEGEPTCWSSEINHSEYGKYVWITENDNRYSVEVDYGEITELVNCKSLASAKRWVSTNLK